MVVLLGGYLLGLLLGLRHALEPDHLLAVSTLVAERRPGLRPWMLGATWGLGHTVALFVVGGGLAVMQRQMPARAAAGFEALVGGMLIVLGAKALLRALKEGRSGRSVVHQHRARRHEHAGLEGHIHLGSWSLAPRPLLVGLVHGLAGSGAITTLVLAGLPSTSSRLGYIALFGLGSVFGMAVLTWAAGGPLQRLQRFSASSAYVLGTAGLCSALFGASWLAAALPQAFA